MQQSRPTMNCINGSFIFSLKEIVKLAQKEPLFLGMIDNVQNKIYISKGKCSKAKFGYSYGDKLVFTPPEDHDVVKQGKRGYLGQYNDETNNLVWYIEYDKSAD